MPDNGDAAFAAAVNGTQPSGPGGVTRDRAVQLARSGLSVDAAYAQATAETSAGTNPRDPTKSGDPTVQAANAAAATAAAGGTAPVTHTTTQVGAQSGFMTWLTASTKPQGALIAGVPNWGVLIGGLVGYKVLLGKR